MSQFNFDGTNNLSDAFTTLTQQLASGATLPATITVTDAAVFENATFPIILVLSPVTEGISSAVEEVRCASVNVGTGTVTISARGLDMTTVATWPVGSYISARLVGEHLTDLQTAANALGATLDAAEAYEYLNFSEQFQS